MHQTDWPSGRHRITNYHDMIKSSFYRVLMAPELRRYWNLSTLQPTKTQSLEMSLLWFLVESGWVGHFIDQIVVV